MLWFSARFWNTMGQPYKFPQVYDNEWYSRLINHRQSLQQLGRNRRNLRISERVFQIFPDSSKLFQIFPDFSPFQNPENSRCSDVFAQVHRDLRGQQGPGRAGGNVRLRGGHRGRPAQADGWPGGPQRVKARSTKNDGLRSMKNLWFMDVYDGYSYSDPWKKRWLMVDL